MSTRIRQKEGENLTDLAIESVIEKLNCEKPITKKEACDILHISYNTTRLKKIIEKYVEDKEYALNRRKALRNIPLSNADTTYIVSAYLEGISLKEISNASFRSISLIKRTLSKYNIPIRNTAVTYQKPIDLMHEEIEPEDYSNGSLVYSARYDSTAEIIKVMSKGIYRIWLFKDSCFAYQPSYELNDLRKVQDDLNIKIEYLTNPECQHLIAEGLRNSRKKERDKNK